MSVEPKTISEKWAEWKGCNLNTRNMNTFGVTSVALAAITLVVAAIAFVTLALLQHYNVIHIGGKFGAALAESGKGIMVALNAIKHGATTAAKTIAHGVQYDLASQLTLTGVGSLALGAAAGVGGMKLKARRQEKSPDQQPPLPDDNAGL